MIAKFGIFFWTRPTGAGGKEQDSAALAKRTIHKLVPFVPDALSNATYPDRANLRLSIAMPRCAWALRRWKRGRLWRGLGGWGGCYSTGSRMGGRLGSRLRAN